MKKVEVTPDLSLEALLQQLNGEELVLTRAGHAIAILSDCDDDDPYWQALENDPTFIASIAQAREEIAQGKGIPVEEVKRELGLD